MTPRFSGSATQPANKAISSFPISLDFESDPVVVPINTKHLHLNLLNLHCTADEHDSREAVEPFPVDRINFSLAQLKLQFLPDIATGTSQTTGDTNS